MPEPGSARLRVAAVVPQTTAEGPGLRFAVWVQGCTLGCKGCCNPQMLQPGRGQLMEVATLLDQLSGAARAHGVEGLTVLGGEPLQQPEAVAELCRGARARGLGVIVFSGYTLPEIEAEPRLRAVWTQVDTLVDGRYDATRPEPAPHAGGRRFIGSSNQGLRHRTARYADPRHWRGAAGIEVRLDAAGALSAHGEPQAVRDLLRALAATS